MNRFTRFPALGAACFERTPALSGTAASRLEIAVGIVDSSTHQASLGASDL
jgi:hypothetical protein